MEDFERGRLSDLGPVPLAVPPVICTAIFIVATSLFALPPWPWAFLSALFCGLWYLQLARGLRRVPRARLRKRKGPAA